MKKLLYAVSILAVAGLVQAQSVPDFVNYQGRLTDEGGTPLATGDYALRFEVYDDPIVGSRVWGPLCFDLETGGTPSDGHKFKVPVVQGYFNVVLDQDNGYTDCSDTTPDGDGLAAPVSTAFTAALRYVEVAVWNETGSVWEPILPRQHVLSAPYAVSAASAIAAGRSQEVVSAEGQPTRIACKTGPTTEVDVVTVDTAGVDVAGDLTVLNNASVDGNVGIGTTPDPDPEPDDIELVVNGTVEIGGWADQSKTQNGHAWVGGILVQWGVDVSTSDDDQDFYFPTPFPTQCFAVTFSIPGVATRDLSFFTVNRMDNYSGAQEFSYMAIGY